MGEVEEDYRYFWDWREEKMSQEELKQQLVGFLIEANVTMFPHSVANHLISNGVTIRECGEWIKRTPCSEPECSRCGRCPKLVFGMLPDFCSHCGADMRGGKDE